MSKAIIPRDENNDGKISQEEKQRAYIANGGGSNTPLDMSLSPKYDNGHGVQVRRINDMRAVDGGITFNNGDGTFRNITPEQMEQYNQANGLTPHKPMIEGRPPAAAPAFLHASAMSMLNRTLGEAKNYGTAPMHEEKRNKESKSRMQRFLDGDKEDDDDLPIGPGFAMMTHLFKNANAGDAMKKKHQNALTKGMNIFTDALDGVKTALRMIGLHSDTNIGGLPIDMKDALKMFYGDKEITDVMKSDFMHDLQDGVNKIDPKKVRKFVNHDGSLTWELLNDDKTVMNRFTFGDYKGKKIFAQGGYKNFAHLYEKAKRELGPDLAGEFDATMARYKR